MKLYPDCGYFHEERDDPHGPDDHENCEYCMRYDLCKENYLKQYGVPPDVVKEPLTPVELVGMTGRKVWVQSPNIPEYGRMAVIEHFDAEHNVLYLVNDFTCHGYGTTWVAHLPKEAGD